MTGSGHMRFLVAVGLAVAVVAGLGLLTQPDHGVRNYALFTEMMHGPASASYSAQPLLPGGRTLQPLMAGVVIRGQQPFRFGSSPEEAERAGREWTNPRPRDDAALAEGAALFNIYCLPCHDAQGNGQGPATLRGMLRPPSLHAARALELPDGQLFHVITRGQGNMASQASQLSPSERWAVVHWIRALQEGSP